MLVFALAMQTKLPENGRRKFREVQETNETLRSNLPWRWRREKVETSWIWAAQLQVYRIVPRGKLFIMFSTSSGLATFYPSRNDGIGSRVLENVTLLWTLSFWDSSSLHTLCFVRWRWCWLDLGCSMLAVATICSTDVVGPEIDFTFANFGWWCTRGGGGGNVGKRSDRSGDCGSDAFSISWQRHIPLPPAPPPPPPPPPPRDPALRAAAVSLLA